MARVLIVDDDPDILHLLTKILSVQGHAVFRAEDAIKAMDLLNSTVFDLLISDANMPKFSGFELIRTVKNNKKFQPMAVAMLTSLREKKDIEQGIRAGVDDYIIKPIDPMVLLEKVDELFIKKPPRTSSFFELSPKSHFTKAKYSNECKIVSFDEFNLNFLSDVKLEADSELKIEAELFNKMKINPPLIRVIKCSERKDGFIVSACYLGLRDPDMKRIRTWIMLHGKNEAKKSEAA